jgi:DNA (cytosine-5)-methyltransferase 1
MKPRLLDLFCGAGGCSMGYWLAGFEVVGVDIDPHPDYPFDFIQADALTVDFDDFDAIHASPPCQAHTTMSNRWRGAGGEADSHDALIPAVRWRLVMAGVPYVIENVPGARDELESPFILSGGMFGLRVHRPRLFETNWPIGTLPNRRPVADPIGVYGKAPDGRRLFTRKDGSIQRAASSVVEAGDAMGIAWMTDFRDIAEAVPPPYTEFIGRRLLAHLEEVAA